MRHTKSLTIVLILTISSLPPSAHAREQQSARAYHQFFRASFAHAQGNHAQAELWFDKLTSTVQNTSPWHLKSYATFLVDSNQTYKIHGLIEQLDAHFPNDISAQLTIARALEASGSTDDAYQRIIDLHSKHPSNPQVALLAVQSAMGSQKPKLALRILERFVNNHTRQTTLSSFFLMKAQLHYTLGQKQEALAALAECVELNPQHTQAWFLKAQLEAETGDQSAAARSLQALQTLQGTPSGTVTVHAHAPESENDHAEVQTGRGRAFDTALALITQKKYDQAAPKLLQYVQDHATDDQARILAIQTLIRTGQSQAARTLIQEAINKQPNEATWYALLKASLDTPEEHEYAVSLLQETVADHPTSEIPKMLLAEFLLEAGRLHEGDNLLGQIIRGSSNPKIVATALQVQSVLVMQQGNEPLAISLLERAHEVDPQDQRTSLLLLQLYKTENAQPKKGLKLAEALLKENPKDSKLHLIKGEFCLACGQFPQAIECLEQLTLLEPANAHAWSLLSKAQLLAGNKKRAFHALKRANRASHATAAASGNIIRP